MQEKIFSTKEAADILKVSLRTFRRWKHAGKVTPDIVRGQNEFYYETQLRTLRTLRTTEDMSPVKKVTGDTIVPNDKSDNSTINSYNQILTTNNLESEIEETNMQYDNEKTKAVDETAKQKKFLNENCTTQSAPNQHSNFKSNVEGIANELKNQESWITWKLEERDGKQTKVPYSIVGNRFATCDATNIDNAVDLDKALKIATDNHCDGLGFILDGGGVVILDVDHCINDDGTFNQIATELLNDVDLKTTYVEYSQSKKGLHFIFSDFNVVGIAGRKNSQLDIEIYANKHYFAITGYRLEGYGSDLADCQNKTKELIEKYFDGGNNNLDTNAQNELIKSRVFEPAYRDEQILEIISHCKNHNKFDELFYNGSKNAYNGDDSSADAGLMLLLAFYTNGNSEQMERLFSKSKLAQRDKWQQREDYRRMTLAKTLKYWLDNGAACFTPRLKLNAQKIQRIIENMQDEESSYEAMTQETLKLADSIRDTQFDYIYLKFKNKIVKKFKILTSKEFERKIEIACGRADMLEAGDKAGDITTKSLVTDCPIDLSLPSNFQFNQGGVFTHNGKICFGTPTVVTKKITNVDDGSQRLTVSFLNKDTNKWQSVTAGKEVFYNHNKIIGLAKSGLDVTSSGGKYAVDFLQKLMIANSGKIPISNSVIQTGWRNGFNKFIYPPSSDGYLIDVAEGSDHERIYTQKGDRTCWLDHYVKMRKYPVARATIAVALAAPLAKIIGLRNMVFEPYGLSGGGKSSTLKFAMSIYGNPKYSVPSFNSTGVYHERRAAASNDLPCAFDDLQTANKNQRDNLDVFAHTIGEGVSRGRGNTNGGTDAIIPFRTIALITGEQCLTSHVSGMGKIRRTVGLHIKQVIPLDLADETYKIIAANYGLIGREWVAFIKDHIAAIQEFYDKCLKRFKEMRPDAIVDHIKLIAAAYTADCFFNVHFCNVDDSNDNFDDFKSEATEQYKYILSLLIKEVEAMDVTRAADFIKELIQTKTKHFWHNDVNETELILDPAYGVIRDQINDNEKGYVAFFPTILRNELKNEGFNADKAIKELAEIGFIERGNDRQIIKNVKLNGKPQKMYKITLFNSLSP